jgi:hypothetical protein
MKQWKKKKGNKRLEVLSNGDTLKQLPTLAAIFYIKSNLNGPNQIERALYMFANIPI